jgi:hypothetical protein
MAKRKRQEKKQSKQNGGMSDDNIVGASVEVITSFVSLGKSMFNAVDGIFQIPKELSTPSSVGPQPPQTNYTSPPVPTPTTTPPPKK